MKLDFEKEAFYNEKDNFFKVNFMLSNGNEKKNNENNQQDKNKKDLKEAHKKLSKLSLNNLSLPTTNFTGSFTSKIINKVNSEKTSMDVRKDITMENNFLIKSKKIIFILFIFYLYNIFSFR
jgi:hypothetical protein